MNCIVVVDENWNIGKDGDLLVHLPGDLKYFKKKTIGKSIVIGRKTLESFPGARPLPGRENIVLTRNEAYRKEDCIVIHSKKELEEQYPSTENLFICGGENIYRQFLEECDTFYVTKIFEAYEADKSFPCLDDRADMKIVWRSEIQEEKGIRYQFLEYKRNK